MSSSVLESTLKRLLYVLNPKSLINNSALFDRNWYEKMYKIPAGKAADHYLKKGYLLHYNPSRLFDGDLYLVDNPDVKRMNPLLHYEAFGYKECRKMSLRNNYLYNKKNTKLFEKTDKKDIGVFELCDEISAAGGKVYGREYIKADKLVFVFSHELSRTGAPLVLEKFVATLKKLGYSPLVISFMDGFLVNSYLHNNVPVIVYEELLADDLIPRSLNCAEFCIVNSLNPYICRLIAILSDARKKTIWWVHESKLSYNDYIVRLLPKRLSKNIRILTAGWYAKEALLKVFPEYKADVLVYGVSEESENFSKKAHDKTVFSVIGSFEPRKGHSAVFKAIELIPDEILKKCEFRFAGRMASDNIGTKLERLMEKYPNNIRYYGVLDTKGISELYSETDCLICCSYDDPLPVVVTDAWRYEIPTICSENIGQSKLIEEYDCGILYKNNDHQELRGAIVSFCNGDYDLPEIIRQAKYAFHDYFSMPVFEDNIRNAINSLKEKAASTYSVTVFAEAKDDFKNLVDNLKKQQKIDLQIVLLNKTVEDVSIPGCQVLDLCRDSFESAVSLYLKENKCDYVAFIKDCNMENNLTLYSAVDEMDAYGVNIECLGENYKGDQLRWMQFLVNRDTESESHSAEDRIRNYCLYTSHAYLVRREHFLDNMKLGDGDECSFKKRLLASKSHIMLAKKNHVELMEPVSQGHMLRSVCEFNKNICSSALIDTDSYFEKGVMQRTVLTYYLYAVIFADLAEKYKVAATHSDTLFDLIIDIMTKTEIKLRTSSVDDFYDYICRKPAYFDDEMYDLALKYMYMRLFDYKPNKLAVDSISNALIGKLHRYLSTYGLPENKNLLDLVANEFIPYWVTYKIANLNSGIENSFELSSEDIDY